MAYIIPPRFYKPLEKEDLAAQGWRLSSITDGYFLEGSLTDIEHSGVWLRQQSDTSWIIVDCNYKVHRTLHSGPLSLIGLIRLTHRLWTS